MIEELDDTSSVDLSQRRAVEIAWLATHPDRVAGLTGQWVALDGKELLGHGSDLATVLREVMVTGHEHPFITRVPDPDTAFVF